MHMPESKSGKTHSESGKTENLFGKARPVFGAFVRDATRQVLLPFLNEAILSAKAFFWPQKWRIAICGP